MMWKCSSVLVVCLYFRLVYASNRGTPDDWTLTFDDEDDDSAGPGWKRTEGSGDLEIGSTTAASATGDLASEDVKALLSRMENLDQRVRELESETKNQRATIKELEHKVKDHEENIARLKTNIKALDEVEDVFTLNVMELKNHSRIYNEKILELENKNKVVERKIMEVTNTSCNDVDRKMITVENKNGILSKKVMDLEHTNKAIEKRIDRHDQYLMRNVLVFLNVPELEGNDYVETLRSVVLEYLNKAMKLMIGFEEIADVRRDDDKDLLRCLDAEDVDEDFLRNRSRASPRPLLVRFVNYQTKLRVLEAKENLNNTDFKVLEVNSEFITQRRKALKPFLEEKREQELTAVLVNQRKPQRKWKWMTLGPLVTQNKTKSDIEGSRKKQEP